MQITKIQGNGARMNVQVGLLKVEVARDEVAPV